MYQIMIVLAKLTYYSNPKLGYFFFFFVKHDFQDLTKMSNKMYAYKIWLPAYSSSLLPQILGIIVPWITLGNRIPIFQFTINTFSAEFNFLFFLLN